MEEEELRFRVDFYKNIGADFMNWGPMGCIKTEMRNVTVKRKQKGNNLLIKYETPQGNLEEAFVFSIPSQTLFRKNFLIKRNEDFKVYKYILENTVLKMDFSKANTFLNIVGDNGAIFLDGIAPPLHPWVNDLLGIKELTYALLDQKKELGELLETQENKNLERCKILSSLPVKVFLHQATWDVGNISPDYYQKYYLPYLKKYNKILHHKGKKCLDHLSGQKIKPFLELIENTNLDGLYGLTYPSPPGDISFAELSKRLIREKMIPIGGLNCDFLANASSNEVAEMTKRFLEETGGKPSILGTADDVVYGTQVKKLETISETIRKFYG